MPKCGYVQTEEHRKNLSLSHKGIPNANKGKKRPEFIGENHPRWKGGSKTKEYTAAYSKEYRHRMGISKKYNSEQGISYTDEYKRLNRKKYKYLKKNAGDLTIETIRKVYDDNIKENGVLTCYLCSKKIDQGRDNLEHKIPLSRGGTNEYENLGVAHDSCNNKKRGKTEKEYRGGI